MPQGSTRQLGGGGNLSFAQSLSGTSQPATPLDPSEFPSLSGTSQLNTSNQNSMWSGQTSRNLGQGGVHRAPGTPLSSQQPQQEDMFPSASRLGGGPSFRFGSQATTAQPSQGQPDEFPPLNRTTNGEIGGQDRGSLMSSLAFGSAATASGPAIQARAGNGLLNAISANSRTADGISPTVIQRPQDPRSPVGDDESRQKPPGYREDSLTSHASGNESVLGRNPLGAIGNDPPLGKVKEDDKGQGDAAVQDPLERMASIDKWGLKGLHYLMNNYQDYNALTCGIDPASLGVDLRSPDLISTQIYSLFNNDPPRPAVPKFKIPDCYEVKNVQPIENKITGFNEETLFWIFYSCPRELKQQLAAMELVNRNWRWHKKLRLWLTKDEQLIPQALSPNHERGYYIVWDKDSWRKERREFTLFYSDLDSSTPAQLGNGVVV